MPRYSRKIVAQQVSKPCSVSLSNPEGILMAGERVQQILFIEQRFATRVSDKTKEVVNLVVSLRKVGKSTGNGSYGQFGLRVKSPVRVDQFSEVEADI
ncbi:hypothetical protein [Corynebacterium phocae]|uniref:hypothetical protein n=1 Tax=Corynebacterium phocae TaxID=161895 RepID=UPI002011C9DF|nr:hypothetical protein [Corynebacterium phocae]